MNLTPDIQKLFGKEIYLWAGMDNPVAMSPSAGRRRRGITIKPMRWGRSAAGARVRGDCVSYAYDVYGRPRVMGRGPDGNWLTEDTATQDASAVGNPYLFTARRWDAETNLYHYRARDYTPALGRFLQPDPLGYIDGMNLYQYCGNNPLNWIDPWGLKRYNYRWYNIPLWPLVFANNLGETLADGIEGAYGMYEAMKNPPPPLDLDSESDSRAGATEKFKHDAFDVAKAVPHTTITGPAPAPTGIADVVTDIIVDAIADISEDDKGCQ